MIKRFTFCRYDRSDLSGNWGFIMRESTVATRLSYPPERAERPETGDKPTPRYSHHWGDMKMEVSLSGKTALQVYH